MQTIEEKDTSSFLSIFGYHSLRMTVSSVAVNGLSKTVSSNKQDRPSTQCIRYASPRRPVIHRGPVLAAADDQAHCPTSAPMRQKGQVEEGGISVPS